MNVLCRRQFFYGVSFYVIATLLVLFLPIFVSSTVDKTMLILQVMMPLLVQAVCSCCLLYRIASKDIPRRSAGSCVIGHSLGN